jgi:glyoxylase-like metal-dependent hydrolase (beta-lactamase superfamily II)
MELAGGVYALEQTVTQGGRTVTFYPAAVETPQGPLLIDLNYEGHLDAVEASLEEVGLALDDAWGLVLTHQDSDHAGALAEFRERTDAVVFAHRECAPYVDGREHPIKSPEDDRYPPADVNVELVEGVTFATEAGPMEVIETPGHTPGHVSLYFREAGLLVTADALTTEDGTLAGPSEQYTPEMEEALDSAEKLADRSVDRILCFHGGPVEADADRIREVVEANR